MDVCLHVYIIYKKNNVKLSNHISRLCGPILIRYGGVRIVYLFYKTSRTKSPEYVCEVFVI